MREIIFRPQWLDVVFQGKNQLYGAYLLRKEYEKNSILGLLIGNGSILGIFMLAWAANTLWPKPELVKEPDITICRFKIDKNIEVILEPKEKILPKKHELPPQKPAGKNVKTADYTPPVVTDDEKMKEATKQMASTDELKDATISNTTSEGVASESGNEVKGNGTETSFTESEKKDIVPPTLDYVDKMPAFPEKYGTLGAYLGSRIRIPHEAASSDGGRVYVEFIVDENGNITNVKVLKGIGHGCDEEAMRVISAMPTWNPGKQSGKPVRVRMRIPINFQFN